MLTVSKVSPSIFIAAPSSDTPANCRQRGGLRDRLGRSVERPWLPALGEPDERHAHPVQERHGHRRQQRLPQYGWIIYTRRKVRLLLEELVWTRSDMGGLEVRRKRERQRPWGTCS